MIRPISPVPKLYDKKRSSHGAPTKSEREHISRVVALGCVICRQPAQYHHVRHGQGMGQRASHMDGFGLCPYHHTGPEGIHTLGTKVWQERYGNEKDLLEQVRQELAMQLFGI